MLFYRNVCTDFIKKKSLEILIKTSLKIPRASKETSKNIYRASVEIL